MKNLLKKGLLEELFSEYIARLKNSLFTIPKYN